MRRHIAIGKLFVIFDHLLQHALFFFVDGIEQHHFHIAVADERLVHIPYVSNTAAHTRCEVPSGFAKDDNLTTRHVFAAVVAHAFYNNSDTRVAHSETLASHPADVSFARSPSEEGYVTDDDVLRRIVGDGFIGIEDQLTSRKSFAEIVVRIAFEFERKDLWS